MDSSPGHRLILDHLDLAARLARGYAGRGIDTDDLMQVARLGLVQAAGHYDPGRGDFAPFAAATIRGELKRHFRDHGWALRPPRRVQEVRALLRASTDEPVTSLTSARIASLLGVPEADVQEAARAADFYTLASVDDDSGPNPSAADPGFDHVDDVLVLRDLCSDLDRAERQLLRWRFVEELSQSQIGALTGASQVQVSRRLARLLRRLRERVLGEVAEAA